MIGCGRIAERGWLPAIARVPNVRLAAVVDRDLARCATVAPGVAAYVDAADLTGVDAAIVATPAGSHVSDAETAGVPALVEKPPAPTAAETRKLAALEPPPFIGFNRRFDPALRRLRGRVEGDVGLRFHYRRSAWAPLADRTDALLDLGSHLVDLARWLSGAEVVSVPSSRLDADWFELELKLERGRAFLEGSTTRLWLEEVAVAGERRYRRGGLVRLRRSDALVASLAAELEAFVAVVRGRPPDELATVLDGLAAMETLDAAREAASSSS